MKLFVAFTIIALAVDGCDQLLLKACINTEPPSDICEVYQHYANCYSENDCPTDILCASTTCQLAQCASAPTRAPTPITRAPTIPANVACADWCEEECASSDDKCCSGYPNCETCTFCVEAPTRAPTPITRAPTIPGCATFCETTCKDTDDRCCYGTEACASCSFCIVPTVCESHDSCEQGEYCDTDGFCNACDYLTQPPVVCDSFDMDCCSARISSQCGVDVCGAIAISAQCMDAYDQCGEEIMYQNLTCPLQTFLDCSEGRGCSFNPQLCDVLWDSDCPIVTQCANPPVCKTWCETECVDTDDRCCHGLSSCAACPFCKAPTPPTSPTPFPTTSSPTPFPTTSSPTAPTAPTAPTSSPTSFPTSSPTAPTTASPTLPTSAPTDEAIGSAACSVVVHAGMVAVFSATILMQ